MKKRVAFISIAIITTICWLIGFVDDNDIFKNLFFSFLSGGIVGFLCNIYEREHQKDLLQKKDVIIGQKNKIYAIINNLNDAIDKYTRITNIIDDYVNIGDKERRRNDYPRVFFEISEIRRCRKIENENFSKEEKQLINEIEAKFFYLQCELDIFKCDDFEFSNGNRYITEKGIIVFYTGMLNDVSELNRLILKRKKELSSLEKNLLRIK